MQKERSEELAKLVQLNKEFLKQIESGKNWEELKEIREQMKELAKRIDYNPATLVDFDSYPLKNTGESQK